MNKSITPLTEREVLAWQEDRLNLSEFLNPVNGFILLSLQETRDKETRRQRGPPFLCF